MKVVGGLSALVRTEVLTAEPNINVSQVLTSLDSMIPHGIDLALLCKADQQQG
jgi:hypothetical protein